MFHPTSLEGYMSKVIGLVTVLSLLIKLSSAKVLLQDLSSEEVSTSQTSNNTTGLACCNILAGAGLLVEILYPINALYTAEQATYWAAQNGEIKPACYFQPRSTSDVSRGVTLLVSNNCKFTSRGGGHSPNLGFNNIDNGVTIDNSLFGNITLSDNNSYVSIAPGAQWGNVYKYVEQYGLSVTGGRLATVGVAGLVLGGGLSFYAPRYGFACDNIRNFEIVLASGKVVNANIDHNADLYKALKGGSKNFGIVTRFDLNTFQGGDIYGGIIVWSASAHAQDNITSQVFNTAAAFAANLDYNPFTTFIASASYVKALNGYYLSGELEYTNDVTQAPPDFAAFLAISRLSSTERRDSMSNLATEFAVQSPRAIREIFRTLTVTADKDLALQIFHLSDSVLEDRQLKTLQDPSLAWSFSVQPVPVATTSKGPATGGNSLGVTGSPNLLLILIAVSYASASDDSTYYAAVDDWLSQAQALARGKGMLNAWEYLNYAGPQQHPLAGYGTLADLRAVSQKYDPTQAFQRLVPGFGLS